MKEIASENAIHADGSAYQKGEITLFDISISNSGSPIELALSYSENVDGTNAQTTEKIDITKANAWVNLKLNDEFQLEVVDVK